MPQQAQQPMQQPMQQPQGFYTQFFSSSAASQSFFLNGNGDFFNEEMKELRAKADIIVTNPPFSCLKEIITTLIKEEKDFILVGNENVFSNRQIFPLIKDNKIRIGFTKIKQFFTDTGEIKKFGNIVWITNLPINKPQDDLNLTKKYSSDLYPKYENYDAINVDRLTDIPVDYEGVMGVPITYINKQSSEFEIVGFAGGVTRKNGLNYEVPYYPHPDDRGGNGIVNGIRKYARVLIRRIKK